MEELTATIRNGDRVVLSGVTVRVRPQTRPDGQPAWEGELVLPDGAHLSPGRNYALDATDGRTASIGILRACGGGPAGTTIEFRINGTFAPPAATDR